MKIGAWRALLFLRMGTKLRFCSYFVELWRCAVCAVDYVTGHAVCRLGCRMPGGSLGPQHARVLQCVTRQEWRLMTHTHTHTHTQIVFTVCLRPRNLTPVSSGNLQFAASYYAKRSQYGLCVIVCKANTVHVYNTECCRVVSGR